MITCLAIVLKQNSDRLKALESEMKRIGQPFQIIDGVDGGRLDQVDFYQNLREEFPEYLPYSREDIPLKNGEIGCFLSMIRAYRYSRDHDLPHTLIVEDDVQFHIHSSQFFEDLTHCPFRWDMIKLAHTSYPLVRGIPIGKQTIGEKRYSFYFYWQGILGTTCSLYTRQGIVKLLESSSRFSLTMPIDTLIEKKRHQMRFVPLFIRPEVAGENPSFSSSIISGRSNQEAFLQYLHNRRFLRRKVSQFWRLVNDLKKPIRSSIDGIKKLAFYGYVFKFLFKRKKPSPARDYRLLGSSVVSANAVLFRQFGVKIPWFDPLLSVVDIPIGIIYWITHPSQYPVATWWIRLTRRRLRLRTFAAKLGEATLLTAFACLRQAGYYGRWWRHCALGSAKGFIMWNGWRSVWARKALAPKEKSMWFLENAPLPNCLTMDPNGVNAQSYLPKDPNFYLAWAIRNPQPHIRWKEVVGRMSARPPRTDILTSNRAIITKLPDKFIFVPLQKQDDSQIYLNAGWVHTVHRFIKFIYQYADKLPSDWVIIIKTHPSDKDIEPEILFRKCPRNVYNGARFDSIDLLSNCSAVANINGSMGLQAYLYDKPSIVTGNSFYAFGDMATRCHDARELCQALANVEKLTFDKKLRNAFLNFLLNHYYLKTPNDLPRRIVESRLIRYRIDVALYEQFNQRLSGKWDPWAGLGSNPDRWEQIVKVEAKDSGRSSR